LCITPWAPPHAYANRRWGNPAGMQGCVNFHLKADGLRKGWGFQVRTWNVDLLTGRAGEVVQALSDRKVTMACIQETQWKGSSCKFYETKGQRYKLFWMGGDERLRRDICSREMGGQCCECRKAQ